METTVTIKFEDGAARLTCCGEVLREALDMGGFVCERCQTFYGVDELKAYVQNAIETLTTLRDGMA